QRGDPHMVAALDYPASVRRADVRRLQRTEVHSCARDREHGRPQVRRVFTHPYLPRPLRRQEGEAGIGDARRLIMGKKAQPRRQADNEAKAYSNALRTSARKLNVVAQAIRGKDAANALAELEFSRRRIAIEVRKVLQAAIANAENNHQLDVDRLY